MRPHLLLAAALLAASACGGTSGNPTVGGNTNVQVLLTDSPFPFDKVARADLFIVSVSAGSDSGSGGSDCTGATLIAKPNKRFNLLALQRGATALIGEGNLSAGSYGAVCVVINTDSSSLTLKNGTVLNSRTNPGINWSATGERIIKTDIWKAIAVSDTGGTFVIHFDVGNSFIPAADVTPPGPAGWYYYVPSIEVVDPASVGAISGTVVDGSSTRIVNASIRAMVGFPSTPANTEFVAATGTTDSAGVFKLAFLIPSSFWATRGWIYFVEINPPSASSLVLTRIPGVTVNAGTETALGTITLNSLAVTASRSR